MSVRLSIPKLAASAVAPLAIVPNFSNALLNPRANWPQDVNYLQDVYRNISDVWTRLKEPEQDQELYTQTEPQLRELLLGLMDVSKELSDRADIARDVTNAHHDADVAGSYAKAGDYGMATVYQAYSLTKLHRTLSILIREINSSKKRSGRLLEMPSPPQPAVPPSKEQKLRMKELLQRGYDHTQAADMVGLEYTPKGELIRKGSEKLAYGYDVSGEVQEQGGTSGKDQSLDDQGNSPKMDKTPPNPVSVAQDYEAEEEFPELAEIKHKRVPFPPRTR